MNDPAGLCPQCLIQGAFDSSLGSGEARTQTLDTAAAPVGDDDFGRYHILRPVGEGGMGTVYLAEQREPIRRRVALKVVKLGMDTNQVLARFANERQALAVMEHPNIARILDAGATPKGRPYFVMEYIEGTPITQYCDAKQMPLHPRLALFVAVCRAVQHAHQKGVVHRDLKPSNVLVTEQEGAPVPKVIDFGIAKATDQWAVEKTLLTEFGQMVGTPEYASPEQAEVTTGAVDETSDVYSLGVLLYELLVGAVPFDAETMRRGGLGEMLRIIREEEAPPMSRKLNSMGTEAAEIATRRQTDPASLRRAVNGDLNAITMKALEKERQRRYASVADLVADIERYLEHRPVLASPPSYPYRARKFVHRHRSASFAAAAGIALVTLSVLTVWPVTRHGDAPAAKLANKGTVVLADFANTTGDAAFNDSLRQMMSAELGKSSYFSILSDARINGTLRLMLQAPDVKLTPAIASAICERTGGAAVAEGSITRLGSEYLLRLRVRNCVTGDVLDEEQAPATKKEDVFQALRGMADRFRTRAGALLPAVANEPSLPTAVTTPSLEAWRSFSAAMKAQQRGTQTTEALRLLTRATEMDPQFASAYVELGRQYASFGESELGAQNITKAYQLRNRVSDRENDEIAFNYHRQVTRNLELARQTLESWVQKTPGDLVPHGFLAAFTMQGVGRYDKAAEEAEKAIQIDPNYGISYGNLAFAYLYMNRLTEVDGVLRRASERKIDSTELSLCRYFLAFLRNDRQAMDRETKQRQAKLNSHGLFEQQEALTLAYKGKLHEAGRLSDRAVSLSQQTEWRERAALFIGARAAWSALFDLQDDARKSAESALALYRSRDADYGPAFAFALLQDSGHAHKIELNLEKYTEDTSVQFSYLPALRALDALNHRVPAKALEITQSAIPYDFAVPGTAFYAGAFFGALYPIYVRGLAYAGMGQHREAAAAFQQILEHPAISLNDPIGPMARLQLARELRASGDRVKSTAVYQDLWAVWKDADSDLPAVQEVKARAANSK